MILRSLNNCLGLRDRIVISTEATHSLIVSRAVELPLLFLKFSTQLCGSDAGFEEVLRLAWGGGLDAGEEQGEDGATVCGVLGAAEGEAAVVAGDDAGGDPKAEASAVEVLGGVEGFEETSADGGGDAVAGVGDGDADASARLARGVVGGVVSADEELATVTHGIDSVGDEVVEYLADVVFEADDFG